MKANGESTPREITMTAADSPDILIPADQRVTLTYREGFFEKQGIVAWIDEFKLGTAGYRDTMNMKDFFATDAPFNAHTLMIMAEAMARIYDRRGYGSIHFGGEVRRYTADIIQLVSRIFAAHGISVHLHADKETTPIWASSFGVFYNELDGGANVTASHSQNFKQGFKPLDEKGMQLLDMADEIRDEVRRIGEEASRGSVSITLESSGSSEIQRDFKYLEPYTHYIRDLLPKEAIERIHEAREKGMKVGVSTVGGSMHENAEPIFRNLGITMGSKGMIQFLHWEKRDDFHRVGEIDGENYGSDPTKPVIYRNIGIKEKLLSGAFHFGFIWDPDGDRFNLVTSAETALADRAEGIGLEVERIQGEKQCIVYFKPNQIYFLNTAARLEMMAKSGELFEYDWVIATTYPTSKSIGELADVFNETYAHEFEERGTRIRVFHTPVGFKYFGNMVGDIERRIGGNEEITLENVLGEKVGLGRNPRILIMAEESGGASMGGSRWAFSRNRARRSLALKEKDGMQIALINLGIMGLLYLEGKSFAAFYIQKIEEYDIRYRFYERIDKKLFEESLTGEAREQARAVGNQAKAYMVETFRSFTGDMPAGTVRERLQELVGGRVTLPEVKRIFWAGDGTYIDFGHFWFELRASGTDAVLRFYIEGKEKEMLHAVNRALVAIADEKIRALSEGGA